jgi:hypothetical protein
MLAGISLSTRPLVILFRSKRTVIGMCGRVQIQRHRPGNLSGTTTFFLARHWRLHRSALRDTERALRAQRQPARVWFASHRRWAGGLTAGRDIAPGLFWLGHESSSQSSGTVA